MTPDQIRSLIAQYTFGNYNPMDNDQWHKIRNQLINLKRSQPKEYRDAILDVLESTMCLLNIKELL